MASGCSWCRAAELPETVAAAQQEAGAFWRRLLLEKHLHPVRRGSANRCRQAPGNPPHF
ncbi:MAG: hypothetical protein H6656_10135 [Ardenticatenaceae bacterium]|nr:hypothetical protein [Ardenticatenaceae bacterium]